MLYIAVGDNTNPIESDGYAPIDDRSGSSPWDARKSSANTDDLRGKILRIQVENEGYSIPEGNLFPEDGSEGRPEIYIICLLYTSPSPRDRTRSRMPSSA